MSQKILAFWPPHACQGICEVFPTSGPVFSVVNHIPTKTIFHEALVFQEKAFASNQFCNFYSIFWGFVRFNTFCFWYFDKQNSIK